MLKDKKEVSIQENVHKLVNNFSRDTFIYDLIRAYGISKATITRLKKGSYNFAKTKKELLWKNKVFFKSTSEKDLHFTIDELKKDSLSLKHNPRFIIVTDYKTLLSIDTKTKDSLDIPINELEKNCEFFFPWIGKEKIKLKHHEDPLDIKAAEKMAKLYDAIKKDNPSLNTKETHALNVFFSRLLFCFFAEDTGIFEEKLFTNSIASHTNENGSDLSSYLTKLFKSLDTNKKSSYSKFLQKFPYVNGSLFAEKFPIPKFSKSSRKTLIDCGRLNWASINPDIFGSMIQAVVDREQRGSMGMHYTSVTNIMKVIEPLFLNELYKEFNKSISNPKKLQKLLKRLSTIKIFDPACGSGNFLIIAYKELRSLEIKIFKQLQKISHQLSLPLSRIFLTQFYGIELDDFTHEIAILSLWLAEHQMNVKFKDTFGRTRPSLPLKQGGNIVCGNATRLDWGKICPKEINCEIYILGNPPYLGARNQLTEHKEDIQHLLKHIKKHNNLDYISCWFFLATQYISESKASFAFVSTNSICQGESVPILWPHILNQHLEIGFAHQSFKWNNFAKNNAGVTCVIIGVRNKNNSIKSLYNKSSRTVVKNINHFLRNESNSIVSSHKSSIANLPMMTIGSMANDDGNFMLTKDEFIKIKKSDPKALFFIKKAIGAKEFLHGVNRHCIWINEIDAPKAKTIPFIFDKLQKVKKYRETSKRTATKNLAKKAYSFGERRHKDSSSIIIPRVTSEKREYIPFGFLDQKTVILDSAQAIYDSEMYIFGIISSKMHMTWVKAVAGRLETRIRYSSSLCYNTFPFPDISKEQKETIQNHVLNVIDERQKHPDKTIAELYDPNKMPKGLLKAHHNLDLAIERCYKSKPFKSDEERLEYLFKLYEKMIQKEKEKKGA
ncbi:MAG: hypothetical protein KR126chlam4_00195 [Candidatus Anoxychlamydiales bacterium]|nr:hypothetical protein [Candidatus Anoxychlamydiales bacterium]